MVHKKTRIRRIFWIWENSLLKEVGQLGQGGGLQKGEAHQRGHSIRPVPAPEGHPLSTCPVFFHFFDTRIHNLIFISIISHQKPLATESNWITSPPRITLHNLDALFLFTFLLADFRTWGNCVHTGGRRTVSYYGDATWHLCHPNGMDAIDRDWGEKSVSRGGFTCMKRKRGGALYVNNNKSCNLTERAHTGKVRSASTPGMAVACQKRKNLTGRKLKFDIKVEVWNFV